MPLESVSTSEFVARPDGRCVIGNRWLYACVHERIHVCTLWGEISADDIRTLVTILVGMLDPTIPIHATLVDLGRVDAADEGAFQSLLQYIDDNRLRLKRQIERVAIIPPSGIFGAAARGFFASVAPPYEVKVLAEAEALAWLDADASLLGALADVQRAAAGPRILRELATLLNANPGAVTLAAAARTLGISSRALQRELRESGTTFRKEQLAQQMRTAEQLLAKDLPISQIAYAIGCASPAHFSVLFRKWSGETPTQFRSSRVMSPTGADHRVTRASRQGR